MINKCAMSSNAILHTTAREIFDTVEKIALSAEEQKKRITPIVDHFTGELKTDFESEADALYQAKENARHAQFDRLCREPAIARIVFNGKVWYLCNGDESRIDVPNLVNYYSEAGKWAELNPGESRLSEKARFTPQKTREGWDALGTTFQATNFDTTTIETSLVAWLKVSVDTDEFREEKDVSIIKGIRRHTIDDQKGLRLELIVDEHQGEIFRMPLGERLMILGPPGTGKTTTLVHRLGQKFQKRFLSENEQALIEELEKTQDLRHSDNWLMFTPTTRLKHYLKETFNRARIPAPDTNVQTWEDCSRKLGLEVFTVLKTANSENDRFVLRKEIKNVKDESLKKSIAWFEDFEAWQCKEYLVELRSVAEQLLYTFDFSGNIEESRKAILVTEEKLKRAWDKREKDIYSQRKQSFSEWYESITRLENRLNSLKDCNDDSDPLLLIDKAIEILKLSRPIRNARETWNRMIEKDELKEKKLDRLSMPSIFERPIEYYLDGITKRYRAFRLECQTKSKWYEYQNDNSSDIHPLELDIILLTILRSVSNMIDLHWDDIDEKIGWTALKDFISIFRNQILVDEATDFSPVQLACMSMLAHPRLKSFFACGDFNQRITHWGTRTEAELKWVFPDIIFREITVGYRHCQKLSEFAKAIIHAVDGTQTKVVLPERVDSEGVPVLLAQATSDACITWLAERICEIARLVGKLPSTAIFTDSAHKADYLKNKLNNSRLAESNIVVEDCFASQSVADENYVRIYNIEDIKGLEFEAAFFVGIDRLGPSISDIFDKYLYVGATRAAKFFGMTYEENVPAPLDQLHYHFCEKWS